MIRFKLYFVLLIAAISFFSCHKDKSDVEPPRDRAQQYLTDIASIENYLKTHTIKTVEIDGQLDVEIDTLISGSGNISIWDNPAKKYKMVNLDDRTNYNTVDGTGSDKVLYKLYYLVFNEGGGQKPTAVDSTFTTYKGWTLDGNVFDARDTPLWSTFPAIPKVETQLISGYRQFVPELKTATGNTVGDDGTVTFTNPGMGVVFIPSGLGYFNNPRPDIAPYSPLVFRIRLQSLRYRDHDRDGILSKDEAIYKVDPNPDENNEPDWYNFDTDKDNIPNFLDIDDDGDGYSTRFEIKKADGTLYPFDQIPSCDGDAEKVKKHLNKNCH